MIILVIFPEQHLALGQIGSRQAMITRLNLPPRGTESMDSQTCHDLQDSSDAKYPPLKGTVQSGQHEFSVGE
jgi:hypothetical protein